MQAKTRHYGEDLVALHQHRARHRCNHFFRAIAHHDLRRIHAQARCQRRAQSGTGRVGVAPGLEGAGGQGLHHLGRATFGVFVAGQSGNVLHARRSAGNRHIGTRVVRRQGRDVRVEMQALVRCAHDTASG